MVTPNLMGFRFNWVIVVADTLMVLGAIVLLAAVFRALEHVRAAVAQAREDGADQVANLSECTDHDGEALA